MAKKQLILMFVCSLLLYSSCTVFAGYKEKNNGETSMHIDLQKAIEIASHEAASLGYSLNQMRVEADEQNARWIEYVKWSRFFELNPDSKKDFEGKSYWVIYFGPKEKLQLGGDLWVFVDRQNGSVIRTIRGE